MLRHSSAARKEEREDDCARAKEKKEEKAGEFNSVREESSSELKGCDFPRPFFAEGYIACAHSLSLSSSPSLLMGKIKLAMLQLNTFY